MKTSRTISTHIFNFLLLTLSLLFFSCGGFEKEFKDEDKILHAGPSTGGIGSLSFALYKDSRYRISNSGGVGEFIYAGSFTIMGNIITLNKLDKESSMEYNRLLISRYNEQDSVYWKNKYGNNAGSWQDLRKQDSALGGTGDIYQLDDNNQIAQNEAHFIIRLDSVKQFFAHH